ncbi:hypothetical protein N9262_02235 [Akkermansiaceae bacterium]|nr:hypothetical protein [Akkermansiaceae bacterium]
MNVKQIKEQIDYQIDTLFQAGYDRGWSALLEDLEHYADTQWNLNNKTTAEIVRKLINEMRDGGWNDQA